MERSVTEELVELLKKKKADFMPLSLLNKAPKALRDRLKLAPGANGAQIAKALLPHFGEVLMLKNGSRSAYLAFKLSDEALLLRIVRKLEGKKPSVNNVPFKKSEYLTLLNRLLEQGAIRVKLDKNYGPLLYPAKETPPETSQANNETHVEDVSEKKFNAAYRALERGKFYVRICDLRRYLGWSAQDFDTMLTVLRDAGKIQLQTGDAEFFTEEDIRESFTDENGFCKLTVKWRQR